MVPYPWKPADGFFDGHSVDYIGLNVQVRRSDLKTARDDAYAIFDLLKNTADVSGFVEIRDKAGGPKSLGEDQTEAVTFLMDFGCMLYI